MLASTDGVPFSFFFLQRKREKRPITASGRRSSGKNALQFMNKLDRLVQLHVANIGLRPLATSPTAMQVLRFVTLIDATGREHPILVQCCTSFQVRGVAWDWCGRVADDLGSHSNSKRCSRWC